MSTTRNFFNTIIITTRGNGQKLRSNRRSETNAAKNFFTNEVVGKWNDLPREVVSSTSIDSFKNNLDRHLRMYPIDIV